MFVVAKWSHICLKWTYSVYVKLQRSTRWWHNLSRLILFRYFVGSCWAAMSNYFQRLSEIQPVWLNFKHLLASKSLTNVIGRSTPAITDFSEECLYLSDSSVIFLNRLNIIFPLLSGIPTEQSLETFCEICRTYVPLHHNIVIRITSFPRRSEDWWVPR